MPRGKRNGLQAEISAFAARLKTEIDAFASEMMAKVRDVERDREVATEMRRLMAKTGFTAKNGAPRAAAGGRRRRRRGGNPALETKLVELVKSTKGGLGAAALAEKASADRDVVKSLAQRLKKAGTFKVVGVKRNAKYVFAG